MNTKTMKFALAAVLAVGVVSAQADEDPIAAAARAAADTIAAVGQATAAMPEATVKAVESAQAAAMPSLTAAEMKADAGVQTVLKMQDDAVAVPENKLPKTAKERVTTILSKNGINVGRKDDRYVQVVDGDIPMREDPSKDPEFMVKRDMLCKKVILLAKQQIAEGLGTVFTADERNEIFGSTNDVTTSVVGLKIPTKPVFGVTVLAQAESWDGEKYHMAVGVAWSKALYQAAKAILVGKPLAEEPGDSDTAEWLKENDLSLMCGPRQHVGKDGSRSFLGIAAREIGVNSVADRANRRAAQISAKAHLMFSLIADVEGMSGLNSALSVYVDKGGKDYSKAKEALTDYVAQKIQGRMVEGADEIYSVEVKHPLSGKMMYVSVCSIDSKSVAGARAIIEEMVAARVLAELANKRALGRHQGYQDQVDAAQANTEEFENGRLEGNATIQNRIKPPKPGTVVPVSKPEQGKPQSSQGVFTGETKIRNDF